MRKRGDLCEFSVKKALEVKAKNLAVLLENFFNSDFVVCSQPKLRRAVAELALVDVAPDVNSAAVLSGRYPIA